MDAQQIKAEAGRLPLVDPEQVPTDSEQWEGDEGGAHFVLSRTTFPIVDFEWLALVVTGPAEARASLVRDFCDALGKPAEINVDPRESNGIDMVSWLIPPKQ